MRALKVKLPDANLIIYYVFLISVFNIFLIGSYLLFFCAICAFMFYKRIVTDKTFFLLLLFSLSFAVFSIITGYDSALSSLRVVIFPCVYCLGRNIQFKGNNFSVKKVIVDIAVFMALHMFFNFFYNIFDIGINLFATNTFKDVFSGTISAATIQVSYSFIFCSIIGYFIFMRYGKFKKLILLALYSVLLIYNFALGGRTFLLFSLISIIVGLFTYIRHENNVMTTTKYLFFLVIFICILVILYNLNFLGLKNNIQDSYFFERFFANSEYKVDIFSDGRFAIKGEFIKNMWSHPFGGGKISDEIGFYAHELWLDTYDAAGVIPYIFIVLYTVTSAIRLYKYARHRCGDSEESMIVMSFLITILISFFLEPIISGAPMVLVAYCFVDGVASRRLCSDNGLEKIQGTHKDLLK